MREVGVYDVKTHLARLLAEVEAGETITITRHGKPVARLVPVGARRRSPAEAVAAIREFSKTHTLGGISPRELINEGRKH